MVTFEDIEAEFESQLARIDDSSIRKKVVAAWSKACLRGGWKSIEELRALPFTVATDAKGISLVQHVKAATEGAVALAKIQAEVLPAFPNVDMNVLVAGALLHDLNKVLVIERDEENGFRKKHLSFEQVRTFPCVQITRDAGLPESIVGIVAYECTNAIGSPHNVEAIVVHHADMTTFDTMNYLNTMGLSNTDDNSKELVS